MSATQPDLSFDSGRNHIKPILVAVVIFVATSAVALAFMGLPH